MLVMKKILCVFFLLTASLSAQPVIFTDDRQLPRDHSVTQPIRPVSPAIFAEVPWERVDAGTRRKVLFCDRLTVVLLEVDQAVDTNPIVTHYHAHDQVSCLLEGRALVRVGADEKEIGPGGAYVIPSNVHHGLKPLTPRLLLMDVFTPARDDFHPRTGPP